MNKKRKLGQEPAFATSADLGGEAIYQEGMSKRCYIACSILQGMLASPNTAHQIQHALGPTSAEETYTFVVSGAFKIADEFLRQENQ